MKWTLCTVLVLNLWEINDYSNDEPITDCYYCSVALSPLYDFYCIRCEHPTCDNCSQMCDDCDTITCNNCVESHWLDHQIDEGLT